MYDQNNGILDKKNSDNGFTCSLCGKKFEKNKSIQEKIDGYEYLFNSEDCMRVFKNLANLYGDEFKASIDDEQHTSNPMLASIMPKEQEFGKIKNKIETNENETFEIIKDPIQVQELAYKLAWSSESEILGLFSTANAFHRQERMGMLPKLQQMRKNNDKLKIRILTPFDDDIRLISKKLSDESDIKIMSLGEPSRIRASILLVDRKFVLYIELKDDTSYTSYEAIGPSLFSSIGSTVISYVTIFETMWRQQELYQQLSKFQKQIETYEQTNKQLNDTIDVLLSKMHKNWKT